MYSTEYNKKKYLCIYTWKIYCCLLYIFLFLNEYERKKYLSRHRVGILGGKLGIFWKNWVGLKKAGTQNFKEPKRLKISKSKMGQNRLFSLCLKTWNQVNFGPNIEPTAVTHGFVLNLEGGKM